ncbi:hypothetical protein Q2T40_19080 [Winogradskyella maritima]|uniref:Outer membrane protein n=1 Tax=Winogradskyella maritima TaxID=1517766 RepID=A0ABV8AEP8_9FLAO|nr:hypothetical protein [Winogradskyella maritima]
MSEKKNIDRLFQEKFKDFEAHPKPEVWDAIQARLNAKKKKRRVVPIWWPLGGVAAALLLFFALGGANIFNSEIETDTPIVNTEQDFNIENTIENSEVENPSRKNTTTIETIEVASENKNEDSAPLEKTSGKNMKSSNSSNTYKKYNEAVAATSQNSSSLKDKKEIDDTLKSTISNTTTAVSDVEKSSGKTLEKETDDKQDNGLNKTTTLPVETEKIASVDPEKTEDNSENPGIDINEAIAEANPNNEKEKEEETKLNRWSIAPNVAPVYFNSLGGGSAVGEQFRNNSTSGDVTMSYGISGSYNINPKLKIKAGVNRVDLNHSTEGVITFGTSDFASRSLASNLDNISPVAGSDVTVINSTNLLRSSSPGSVNTLGTSNLDQRFGFIEIPVAVEYRLSESRFGVNLSGGFSTFILNKNEIFTDVAGQNTLIGNANNINDTSFSANFGLGLDYNLSDTFSLNLEPTFKYQINTFNNTSDNFRPFLIGIYSGLSFKF